MITIDIKDFLISALNKYGTRGKGSFEYLGIDLYRDTVTGVKLYRRAGVPMSNVLPLCNDAMLLIERMNVLEDIRCCDISERITKYGDKRFSISYYFKKDMTISRCLEILNLLFKNKAISPFRSCFFRDFDTICQLSSSSCSPLMQLGVEADASGDVVALKYYFTHKSFTNDGGSSAGMDFFPTPLLKAVANSNLISYGYRPSFMGINTYPEHKEIKLYFRLPLKNFDEIWMVTQSKLLLQHICCNIPQELSTLLQIGMFIEGVSVSDSGYFKLYFNILPRTQFEK